MTRKFLFVAVASQCMGIGHLRRMISLAQKAKGEGHDYQFLIFGERDSLGVISSSGLDVDRCIVDGIERMGCYINEMIRCDASIVDVLYSGIDKETTLRPLLESLRGVSRCIAVIDTLGVESLLSSNELDQLDILVAPYIGASSRYVNKGKRVFAGSQYCILEPAYEAAEVKIVPRKAKNILICCGGSDPSNSTVKIVKAMSSRELADEDLVISVVQGPLLSKEQISTLKGVCASACHSIRIHEAPRSLMALIQQSDIVISASGLTKYEATALGVPLILFSIDEKHHYQNKSFRDARICIDLGVGICSKQISAELASLIRDQKRREELARSATSVVSKYGSATILREIVDYMESVSCRPNRATNFG